MFKIKLVPQDKIFFNLFSQLSETLIEITDEFIKFLNDYSNKNNYISKVNELEKKGNKISDELMRELISNFITPIDREDIHSLTKLLNSIVDHVHAATINFDLYNIQQIDDKVITLANVLSESVQELKYLMDKLNNMSDLEKVSVHVNKLHELEEKGDIFYRNCVRDLFSSNSDPLHIIKWKDVYHRMENAIDKCNDAGNTILGMMLKYA